MKQFVKFIIKFAFCALVLAGIIKVVFFFPTTHELTSVATPPENLISPTSPQEPEEATKSIDHTEITINPYDLFQNPYQHKNELVSLDVRDYPVFTNGQYDDDNKLSSKYLNPSYKINMRPGYCGLKFNRMLEESVSLYDIQGINIDPKVYPGWLGASEMPFIGQIAVHNSMPPNTGFNWVIKPLGIITGTNAFGGKINIPLIEVVRYETE